MVKVSFVVIGYNVEKYIENCLKSISNQSLRDIEIIFVDDGSRDSTINIVKKLAKKDERISIIKKKNGGANSARKAGFSKTKGKYVTFVDGDDYIHCKLAEESFEIAEDKCLDILAYNHFNCYTNGDKLDNRVVTSDKSKGYLELILSQKLPHELWNKLYKRKFLINSDFENIKDITMGDDLAANVLLGINNPKFDTSDKGFYYYVHREGGVTKKSSEKTLEIIEALKEVENLLEQNNYGCKFKREIEFLWFYHCYYSKIINVKFKRSEIEEKLYSEWKNKGIKINKNEICHEYKNNLGRKKRIKMAIFQWNYKLANTIYR